MAAPGDLTEDQIRAIELHKPLLEDRGRLEEGFPEYKKKPKYDQFERYTRKCITAPQSVPMLGASFPNAHFIINNFKCCIKGDDDVDTSVTNGQSRKLLPTLTFGDAMVPVRFVNNPDPLDTKSFNRKYVLLDDASSTRKIFELLTKKWHCPVPNVVLSFTNGSIDALESNTKYKKRFITNLYKFCRSTQVWIMTDGLHCGVSRFIGRLFRSDLEPSKTSDAMDPPQDVTLLGMSDWASLQDTTLLDGLSFENEYSSYYFYPKELDLEDKDFPDMLNPYQDVYLLIQKNGGCQPLNLPNNLVEYMKKEVPQPAASEQHSEVADDNAGEEIELVQLCEETLIPKPEIPVVTLVLGGDCETLEQVRKSVEAKTPVVIVQGSGKIPDCLADIYKKMESIQTRSWDHTPEIKDDEIPTLKNLLTEETRKCLGGGQDRADTHKNVVSIMEHRYFLTILDLSNDRSVDFTHVIRAIYKPYKLKQCIKIAFQTDNLNFLKAIFNRELDPEWEEESGFVDVAGLKSLHEANFEDSENAQMFEVDTNMLGQKTLPIVGMVIFNLTGYKYSLLYQLEDSKLESNLEGDNRKQFWHLFLYAVLANKRQFAEFFLTLTNCPLGAALFAHKLFLGMQKYALRSMENEKANSFKESAEHFEILAVKIIDEMYQQDAKEAYRSLNRVLAFDVGPCITPLSVAEDAHALNFINSACVQTYLHRVWVNGMQLSTAMKYALPILTMLPLLNMPFISCCIDFRKAEQPSQSEKGQHSAKGNTNKRKETGKESHPAQPSHCKTSCSGKHDNGGLVRKLKDFYMAPIVKCYTSMVSYTIFLALLSYFFLAILDPVSSVRDIPMVEWVIYIWVFGFIADEGYQLISVKHKGPSYGIACGQLNPDVWSCRKRTILYLRLYKPILYLFDGSWNALDTLMLFAFLATTACRFALPHEKFQLVRIFYGICICMYYFRLLRFFYVDQVTGPRIVAIQHMLTEMVMFIVVLAVFLISFGIAFQGLLNPKQPLSSALLADIFWRTYWPLFGQFYVENEDVEGMGRDVRNTSCLKAKESGQDDLNCYPYAPTFFLALYLFISNILLLNLLIAIFGNTLNKVEESSSKHWAFQHLGMVYEYYYRVWVPVPLNIIWYILCLVKCIKQSKGYQMCCNQNGDDNQNSKSKFPYDAFNQRQRMNETIDPIQRQAVSALQRSKIIHA